MSSTVFIALAQDPEDHEWYIVLGYVGGSKTWYYIQGDRRMGNMLTAQNWSPYHDTHVDYRYACQVKAPTENLPKVRDVIVHTPTAPLKAWIVDVFRVLEHEDLVDRDAVEKVQKALEV